MYNCYKSENHNTPTFVPVAVSGVNLQPVALNIKESLQFDMSMSMEKFRSDVSEVNDDS